MEIEKGVINVRRKDGVWSTHSIPYEKSTNTEFVMSHGSQNIYGDKMFHGKIESTGGINFSGSLNLSTNQINGKSSEGTDLSWTFPSESDSLVGLDSQSDISRKRLISESVYFVDSEKSKKFKIDLNLASNGTETTLVPSSSMNRVVNIPDKDTLLVGIDTVDNLTNKTLVSPVINEILLTNGNILSFPTAGDRLVGRDTLDTLTNKTLLNPVINNLVLNNGEVISLPNSEDTLVGKNTTDILTNKSLISPLISDPVINNGGGFLSFPTTDDTLIGRITTDVLENKTLNSANINNPVLNNGGLLSLPTSADTLVGRATTDSLTNKTIVGPVISDPFITSGGNPIILPSASDVLVGRTTTDTLTNKTLLTPVINNPVINNGAGTLNLPTTSDVLVGRNTVDTLTNKTLASPIFLNAPSFNNGTLFFPSGADTLIGRVTSDYLTNKTLDDATTSISNTQDNTKKIKFDCTSATTGTSLFLVNNCTANRNVSIPNANTTLVGIDTSDTLSNKTYNDFNNFFCNITDPSKRVRFNSSAATTGATLVLSNVCTSNSTITFPNTSTTLVGTATSDFLANKTFNDFNTFFVNVTDTTKRVKFSSSSASTNVTLTLINTCTIDRSITYPNATTTLSGVDTVDTLSNKSLSDFTCVFVDSADQTKSTRLRNTSATTGARLTLNNLCTTSITVNFPTTGTTLVGTGTADTLSNKTFSDQIKTTSTASSTSTTTGCIVGSGGLGIAGAGYFGGAIVSAGNISAATFGSSGTPSAYDVTGAITTTGTVSWNLQGRVMVLTLGDIVSTSTTSDVINLNLPVGTFPNAATLATGGITAMSIGGASTFGTYRITNSSVSASFTTITFSFNALPGTVFPSGSTIKIYGTTITYRTV